MLVPDVVDARQAPAHAEPIRTGHATREAFVGIDSARCEWARDLAVAVHKLARHDRILASRGGTKQPFHKAKVVLALQDE